MAVLYGCAGRLTAENGGFRPGQFDTLDRQVLVDKLRSELRRPLSAARDALALPPSVTEREIEQMDETFEVRRPGRLWHKDKVGLMVSLC